MNRTFFITGTDTGVGKTVLTALLARRLCQGGASVAALKPICSGGRDDGRVLCAAMAGALSLDKINPWHFRAPIAPLLAARREHKRVVLADVLAHVRRMQRRFDLVLVEGAGGLLSPLGENFNSRDLIARLHATSVVVCPNRIGVVNAVLLTLEALPKDLQEDAWVILMSLPKSDAAAGANAKLLGEFFNPNRILRLPWLGERFQPDQALQNPAVRGALRALRGLE